MANKKSKMLRKMLKKSKTVRPLHVTIKGPMTEMRILQSDLGFFLDPETQLELLQKEMDRTRPRYVLRSSSAKALLGTPTGSTSLLKALRQIREQQEQAPTKTKGYKPISAKKSPPLKTQTSRTREQVAS